MPLVHLKFLDRVCGLLCRNFKWVCDGHGDLQAEDIFCLDDGIRILDCIEFSDDLRYGDVCADVAFLAMDLERLGRPDAAERFVLQYEAQAGERLPRPLLHHYIAQRAYVRAKVACLQVEQGNEDADRDARGLHALALRHARRSRQVLVLVGGLPGTGKSTLAAGLAAETGWALLRSDEIRRELQPSVEVAASAADSGRYEPAAVGAVYEELLLRARRHLDEGEPVILDASWIDARQRAAAVRAAAETAASSWSSAAPVRSRWRRHGSNERSSRARRRLRGNAAGSSRHGGEDGSLAVGHHDRHLAPYSRRVRLVGPAGARAMSRPR